MLATRSAAEDVRTRSSSTRPPRPKSTEQIFVELATAQTGCSQRLAKRTLRKIEEWHGRARRHGRCHPSDDELASDEYLQVIDKIMPHDQPSRPGTAHAAAEAHLSAQQGHPVVFMHYMEGDVLKCCAVVFTESMN